MLSRTALIVAPVFLTPLMAGLVARPAGALTSFWPRNSAPRPLLMIISMTPSEMV